MTIDVFIRVTKSLSGQYAWPGLSEPLLCAYVNSFVCQAASAIQLSLVMRKPAFFICENKDEDQLRGNREADQRLCFRYIDSTIPLLPLYESSSL